MTDEPKKLRDMTEPRVQTQVLVNVNGRHGSWYDEDDGGWQRPYWRVTVTWTDGVPSFGKPEWIE